MTDLLALCLTWFACLWFGPPEDEPEPEIYELMTEHYEHRGMCVIGMEDRGHVFAIAYTQEHAVEALTRGEVMVKALVWDAAGEAEVRICE